MSLIKIVFSENNNRYRNDGIHDINCQEVMTIGASTFLILPMRNKADDAGSIIDEIIVMRRLLIMKLL